MIEIKITIIKRRQINKQKKKTRREKRTLK